MRELMAPPEWFRRLITSLLASFVCTLLVGKPVGVWYMSSGVWNSEFWLTDDDKRTVDELMDHVLDGRPLGLTTYAYMERAAVRLAVAVVMFIAVVAMVSRCISGQGAAPRAR